MPVAMVEAFETHNSSKPTANTIASYFAKDFCIFKNKTSPE